MQYIVHINTTHHISGVHIRIHLLHHVGHHLGIALDGCHVEGSLAHLVKGCDIPLSVTWMPSCITAWWINNVTEWLMIGNSGKQQQDCSHCCFRLSSLTVTVLWTQHAIIPMITVLVHWVSCDFWWCICIAWQRLPFPSPSSYTVHVCMFAIGVYNVQLTGDQFIS